MPPTAPRARRGVERPPHLAHTKAALRPNVAPRRRTWASPFGRGEGVLPLPADGDEHILGPPRRLRRRGIINTLFSTRHWALPPGWGSGSTATASYGKEARVRAYQKSCAFPKRARYWQILTGAHSNRCCNFIYYLSITCLFLRCQRIPVAGKRVSQSASQANLPWTTRPTAVTIARNRNCRLRRFNTSQLGELS